ncbi:hypothetical protein BJ170DRAFT_619189 [Xylariales sp. AK1849]|nr:hypothetical protein BJ170DRAFT_619189 [Xylariales sp. AK1849]
MKVYVMCFGIFLLCIRASRGGLSESKEVCHVQIYRRAKHLSAQPATILWIMNAGLLRFCRSTHSTRWTLRR